MKNVSIIQMIILAVAGVAIVAAVLMFSTYRGGPRGNQLSSVTIWGTLPIEIFQQLLTSGDGSFDDKPYSHITYYEINPESFESDFISALAEDRGPDLVLLRENQLIKNKNRLITLPYENYGKRQFQETFIEQGNLLGLNGGYVGFPFAVDPLVMYYNRDILNSAGIAKPPTTWQEMLAITPELTRSDSSFNVSKTAIPLGGFDNIKNAKEIIWSLVLQAGNSVVYNDTTQGNSSNDFFVSYLSEKFNYAVPPAQSAINFYTQFSNPSTTIYSWNNSLPSSEEMFLAGDSAFYLGFASELPNLRTKNPNLNLDVVEIPQSQTAVDSQKRTTFGKLYFLSVTRNASDINNAFSTAFLLTNKATQERLSNITGLPSVRRDLLTTERSTNSFLPVFRRSALISNSVLEPDSDIASQIVRTMIQSILSGEFNVSSAISRANDRLNNELGN